MKLKFPKAGLLICATILSLNVNAQIREQLPQNEPPQPEMLKPSRPSIYDLVLEVREKIGLNQKEFDKLFSAYDKYNKTVFGEEKTEGVMPAGQPMPGGGGPGGGGGFGGPGGGGPGGGGGGMQRGGFGGLGGGGAPGANFQNQKSAKSKEFDPEQFEKTKVKAEDKLCKTVMKTFKKNPEKYNQWLKIRQQQLERLFPQPPQDMNFKKKTN